jgi:hypothetical protein
MEAETDLCLLSKRVFNPAYGIYYFATVAPIYEISKVTSQKTTTLTAV